jgi:hypothetical protein
VPYPDVSYGLSRALISRSVFRCLTSQAFGQVKYTCGLQMSHEHMSRTWWFSRSLTLLLNNSLFRRVCSLIDPRYGFVPSVSAVVSCPVTTIPCDATFVCCPTCNAVPFSGALMIQAKTATISMPSTIRFVSIHDDGMICSCRRHQKQPRYYRHT